MPKRWDLSLNALSQYTTPRTPPENPWIDRPKKLPTRLSGSDSDTPGPSQTLAAPAQTPGLRTGQEPPVKSKPFRRPPSRRLVRHVLRARAQAVRALGAFFEQLQRAESDKKVYASVHLAQAYGGGTITGEEGTEDLEGWRYAREVTKFLESRGAKIPMSGNGRIEGEWAALSSEGEGYTTSEEKEWVGAQRR